MIDNIEKNMHNLKPSEYYEQKINEPISNLSQYNRHNLHQL